MGENHFDVKFEMPKGCLSGFVIELDCRERM